MGSAPNVTVIANYYTGCEDGHRESGVYAGQRFYAVITILFYS